MVAPSLGTSPVLGAFLDSLQRRLLQARDAIEARQATTFGNKVCCGVRGQLLGLRVGQELS